MPLFGAPPTSAPNPEITRPRAGHWKDGGEAAWVAAATAGALATLGGSGASDEDAEASGPGLSCFCSAALASAATRSSTRGGRRSGDARRAMKLGDADAGGASTVR